MVRRNPLEDAGERAGFDWMMPRDDFVVLAVALRGHADVRAPLPGRLIP